MLCFTSDTLIDLPSGTCFLTPKERPRIEGRRRQRRERARPHKRCSERAALFA